MSSHAYAAPAPGQAPRAEGPLMPGPLGASAAGMSGMPTGGGGGGGVSNMSGGSSGSAHKRAVSAGLSDKGSPKAVKRKKMAGELSNEGPRVPPTGVMRNPEGGSGGSSAGNSNVWRRVGSITYSDGEPSGPESHSQGAHHHHPSQAHSGHNWHPHHGGHHGRPHHVAAPASAVYHNSGGHHVGHHGGGEGHLHHAAAQRDNYRPLPGMPGGPIPSHMGPYGHAGVGGGSQHERVRGGSGAGAPSRDAPGPARSSVLDTDLNLGVAGGPRVPAVRMLTPVTSPPNASSNSGGLSGAAAGSVREKAFGKGEPSPGSPGMMHPGHYEEARKAHGGATMSGAGGAAPGGDVGPGGGRGAAPMLMPSGPSSRDVDVGMAMGPMPGVRMPEGLVVPARKVATATKRAGGGGSTSSGGAMSPGGAGGAGDSTADARMTGEKNRMSSHVLTEQRRRNRINDRFATLRSLVPHSDKTDKASFLSEVISYIMSLQQQVMRLGGAAGPGAPAPGPPGAVGMAGQRGFAGPVSAGGMATGSGSGPAPPGMLVSSATSGNSHNSDMSDGAPPKGYDHAQDNEDGGDRGDSKNRKRPGATTTTQDTGDVSMIRLTSRYEHGILDKVTRIMRENGVDVGCTNITVQLDLSGQRHGRSLDDLRHTLQKQVVDDDLELQ
eukprot:jgi/Mesvir1/14286/Mv09716-RA.1